MPSMYPVSHIEQIDMMHTLVHDQFASMFDCIEASTVYAEKLSEVTTRYSCADAGLLVKYVSNKIENTSEFFHPTINEKGVYKHNGKFAIDLNIHDIS